MYKHFSKSRIIDYYLLRNVKHPIAFPATYSDTQR